MTGLWCIHQLILLSILANKIYSIETSNLNSEIFHIICKISHQKNLSFCYYASTLFYWPMSSSGRLSTCMINYTQTSGFLLSDVLITEKGAGDRLNAYSLEIERLFVCCSLLSITRCCNKNIANLIFKKKSNHGVFCRFFSMETTNPNRAQFFAHACDMWYNFSFLQVWVPRVAEHVADVPGTGCGTRRHGGGLAHLPRHPGVIQN